MLSPDNRLQLLDIARGALLQRLADGADEGGPAEPPTDARLVCPSGCFVSLHERSSHRLRGCVGRLDPQLPLWKAVEQTARDVLADPRFVTLPITPQDIPDLELEVSVLSPPREARDPLDFDLLEDGIYLVSGQRAGFFLPQVARETGWTKEQLLNRLCVEKLGLPADTWRKPDAKLYTFKVEVIGPEPV